MSKTAANSAQYWLMKSEPETYPIEQFKTDGKTLWTGVRNFQARGFMIGTPSTPPKKAPAHAPMKVGDYFLFYHSNANPSACMGVGRIEKLNQVDPTQFDKKSDGYEPKASKEKPVWFCCECSFVERFSTPVSLDMIRKEKTLSKMLLLAPGSRLSIQPVRKDEFEVICKLGRKQVGS